MKKKKLTWKNRMLFFLSSSWKPEKSEKTKVVFDFCQAGCGENKLLGMPKNLEKAKSVVLMFAKLSAEKRKL